MKASFGFCFSLLFASNVASSQQKQDCSSITDGVDKVKCIKSLLQHERVDNGNLTGDGRVYEDMRELATATTYTAVSI